MSAPNNSPIRQPIDLRRGPPTGSSILPSTAFAMLAACLVLLPLLGHRPLTDWDEGIYAEVSREMLSAGWLVPHWNGSVWLEKPPLMLWITAGLFKLFAVHEFWARAGSAISGVLLVGLLHGWLARTKDALTAWLSTSILLGTLGFMHVCRVGEMDVLLSLGCAVALIGLTQVDESRPTGWYLFWIGFAIAAMTKGAASVVLLLSAVCVALLFGWGRRRFNRSCWLGLSLFLLLVLPWHLAMFHWFGNRMLTEYFGLHVWARATRQIEGHATPWWYYFKVLIASAPPFVLLYPWAWVDALRQRQLRVWAVFSAVVLLFFTVVQTRLPQYMAPIYPAMAVLTASYLADCLRRLIVEDRPPSFWIKLSLAAAALSLAAVWVTSTARKGLHRASSATSSSPASYNSSDNNLAGNKESTVLLRHAFRQPQAVPGPLLIWRREPAPISSAVFYSRRAVQQVQLLPVTPGVPTDRYTFDPRPLSELVTSEPRLLLLDKDLAAKLPDGFLYTSIESGKTIELGVIVRDHHPTGKLTSHPAISSLKETQPPLQ